MSLRDRLDRLTGDHSPAAEKKKQIGDLRRRIEEILSRRPTTGESPGPRPAEPERQPVELESVAKGEEIITPFGPVFVATDELDAGVFWGRRRLRELAELDMPTAALLADDARLAALAPTDALFLDTETTGLAGGTGTLAFLIGLGWFDGERFVTRLIFSRDFTEEPAALHQLAAYAADKRFLVTFNGKTFDVGLLTARYVLNRRRNPIADLPHLDLLHPSRRLLGHRLENSRLVTLEQHVLGLHRDGDIPGSEIPQRYFDYLRTRDARLVADILRHNRLDVVSMASLAVHLVDLVRAGHEAPDAFPGDVVAAARLHLQSGALAYAEQLLRGLWLARGHDAGADCLRELSLICKRQERWEEAAALWRRQLQADPHDFFAAEEMAKWLEHRQHAFDEAIELVERLLAAPHLAADEQRASFLHRLERLRRKRERSVEP